MFFYEPLSATAIVSVLLYLVFLIGMNELSRLSKWVGGGLFIALPLVLTIFVWPHTAVEGTGAGTWFQWVKTYSCLAGAILGWLIVYFPAFQKKYIVCIPPIIFAINILEACIRDFQLAGVNGIVDGWHGGRRTMERDERHRRHPERHLHLRVLRHHRQPRQEEGLRLAR